MLKVIMVHPTLMVVKPQIRTEQVRPTPQVQPILLFDISQVTPVPMVRTFKAITKRHQIAPTTITIQLRETVILIPELLEQEPETILPVLTTMEVDIPFTPDLKVDSITITAMETKHTFPKDDQICRKRRNV